MLKQRSLRIESRWSQLLDEFFNLRINAPWRHQYHVWHHEVDGRPLVAYRTCMTIHLKPELEAMIQKDVERGPYQSVDDFVERAVQMLHEEEALLANDREVIHEKIERAFGQFERGEGLTPEESRARLQEKKAAWLKQQHP
jgi:putative addiction module CopG family antidote